MIVVEGQDAAGRRLLDGVPHRDERNDLWRAQNLHVDSDNRFGVVQSQNLVETSCHGDGFRLSLVVEEVYLYIPP